MCPVYNGDPNLIKNVEDIVNFLTHKVFIFREFLHFFLKAQAQLTFAEKPQMKQTFKDTKHGYLFHT